MSFDSATMSERVILQVPYRVLDGKGSEETRWRELREIWGKVENLSERANINLGKSLSSRLIRLTIPYNANIHTTVRDTMRFVWRDDVYEPIGNWRNIDNRSLLMSVIAENHEGMTKYGG
jgi:head-tail adaptor